MRTIVEGESSKETSVDSGVPQGTVLSPIMASFTILAVELCYILIIFTKLELFVAF
jgi:hypothetical protein